MTVSNKDIILRDRFQFTPDGSGDLATKYGRIDVSDYVDAVEGRGLMVKEVHFHVRDSGPASGAGPGSGPAHAPNTGIFNILEDSGTTTGGGSDRIKVFATTRAYEFAYDVGIGSPDVFAIYEWVHSRHTNTTQNVQTEAAFEKYVGPQDLHPGGYAVVSDILIGIAADALDAYDNDTLELDVLIVAQPKKLSKTALNQILTQQIDV